MRLCHRVWTGGIPCQVLPLGPWDNGCPIWAKVGPNHKTRRFSPRCDTCPAHGPIDDVIDLSMPHLATCTSAQESPWLYPWHPLVRYKHKRVKRICWSPVLRQLLLYLL